MVTKRPDEKLTDRRKFIKTTTALGIGGFVAGCSGQEESNTTTESGTSGGEAGQKITPESGTEDNFEEIRTLVVPRYNRNTSPLEYAAMEIIEEQVNELGISLDLQSGDLGSILDRAYNPDTYDMIQVSGSASPPRIDPVVYLGFHYQSESSGNYLNYENPDYDDAFETLEQSLDQEVRMEAAAKCQELLAADLPSFFPFHLHSLSAVDSTTFSNWNAVPGTWPYWAPDSLRQIKSNGESDTVIFGTTISPVTLNPMAGAAEDNQQVKKMIYSRLVHVTTDGSFEPRAAEEITVQDETTIDVRLRDDITFHDSEPLTAEDVQFTYEYLAKHGVPDLAGHYEPVDKVEVLDDRTARFVLANPVGSFTTINLSQVNILPKHIWEGVTEENDLSHPREWTDPNLVGSGPFVLEDFQPEASVKLSVHDGHPMDFDFKTLALETYGNQSTIMGDLTQGRITFAQQLTPTNYQSADSSSNLMAKAEPSHAVTYLHFILNKEPMNDIIFRRALTHSVDKEALVNEAAQGLAQVATDVVPPSSPWDSGNEKRYTGGIDRGIKLLRDAGYRWNEDGNLLKPLDRFEGDGPPVYSSDL